MSFGEEKNDVLKNQFLSYILTSESKFKRKFSLKADLNEKSRQLQIKKKFKKKLKLYIKMDKL